MSHKYILNYSIKLQSLLHYAFQLRLFDYSIKEDIFKSTCESSLGHLTDNSVRLQ